uniref:Cytochrome P450 n=1 Tax=Plectus sambesii TaxID=2011161 RepID=A0A914WUW2_9BILA
MIQLLLFAFFAGCIYVCYRLTYPKQWREISVFPGPPNIPLLGTAVPSSQLDVTKSVQKWNRTYGSPFLMKLGPSYLLVASKAEQIEPILKGTTNITKGGSYRFVEHWLGKGLLTSTNEQWHHQRKLLTPTFHYKILQDFLHIMNEQSAVLVDRLRERVKSQAAEPQPFDLCPYITLCALDIICETSMGKRINAQSSPTSPYVQGILEFTEVATYRATHPWTWSDYIFENFSVMGRRFRQSLNTMHQFTKDVIKDREAAREANGATSKGDEPTMDSEIRKKRALMDFLLDMKQKGDFSSQEVREQVDTFMFEGHDTTATGIEWSCYAFGRHPDIQLRLQEEIDSILGPDRSDFPTADQLNEMKYLECCIKESQRMYPPVPYIERTIVDPVDIGDGRIIPVGTTVGINIHMVQMDADHFPEPDKFDPDRFIAENCVGRHPFAFCPFSAGPRNCIGQKFAIMEEKTILCHLLRNFTFESVQDEALMQDTMSYMFVLRPTKGVWVKLTPR